MFNLLHTNLVFLKNQHNTPSFLCSWRAVARPSLLSNYAFQVGSSKIIQAPRHCNVSPNKTTATTEFL
ncbi:hypothetical protein HYC85_003995 [Camellia sinensis]|uniref:Uncharacterized protein n=1 Tax=Camellia sinensis TaxID=4442 RepID=A0A7J7HV84_CAMSI|nr:hypothetical protein HYC85_003995 [Camellia sinensis]